MKIVKDGKIYDTETAEELGTSHSIETLASQSLYLSPNGTLFLVTSPDLQNLHHEVECLSREAAIQWLGRTNGSPKAYETLGVELDEA